MSLSKTMEAAASSFDLIKAGLSLAVHRNVFNNVTLAIMAAVKNSQFRLQVESDNSAPYQLRQIITAKCGDDILIDWLSFTVNRVALAKWEGCTDQMFRALSENSNNTDIIRAIISNPASPESVFYDIAQSNNIWAREIVAESPRCPVEVMRVLVGDDDPNVRVALAANSSCPQEGLSYLKDDKHAGVRAAVASNVNCPESFHRALIKDTDGLVKQAVLKNPNSPEDLAVDFLEDPDFYLRRAAIQKMPEFPEILIAKYAQETDSTILACVAKHPACPPEILGDFAARDRAETPCPVDLDIRPLPGQYVFYKPIKRDPNSFTEEEKRKIADWKASEARTLSPQARDIVIPAVLSNPNCPEHVLTRYASDGDPKLVKAVMDNPSSSVEVIDIAAKSLKDLGQQKQESFKKNWAHSSIPNPIPWYKSRENGPT